MNSYRDPEGKSSFAELLAAVGEVSGIRRVRFTTSHPRDFTRDIVEAIDSVPTLCDHVHLPVQSGSARVLKQMAREYTPEWYLERIAWIKAARRPISLSTDIIVGFPGETDDDFIETMDLLAEVEYDCVFAFKYSARPNTPALVMIDTVPEAEKAKRLQVLLDRQREIQRINYSKHIGEVIEVMVEGAESGRGQISARSSQNKPVNFTWTQPIAPAPGSYLQVRITGAYPNSLVGEASKKESEAAMAETPDREVAAERGTGKRERMDIEVRIRGLMMDPSTNMPIVVLKDVAIRSGDADLGGDL